MAPKQEAFEAARGWGSQPEDANLPHTIHRVDIPSVVIKVDCNIRHIFFQEEHIDLRPQSGQQSFVKLAKNGFS